MPTITLYSNKMSRGRAVHWMLEELGEPYHIEWLDFGPRMKVKRFTAINPMGKVPALTYGDAIITETPAILTFLADTFPNKSLIPPSGSIGRAAFYRWMHFISGPLEAATSAKLMQWETPEKTTLGTPAKGFLGFGTLELTLSTLEQHLKENAYVCGEQFTAADIYLASHLGFHTLISKTVDSRPVFVEYVKRLMQRPAKIRVDNA